FTVDADGERDHYLPWYAPTRLFDVATGMEHGWLLQGWQRSWNRPESFPDNVERLVEIGRGSPTGLTVYRHRQFPGYYRGGVFTACWTLGRVYFIRLLPKEASFSGELETFLQTTGDVGFAPVDLAVGPQGDLFVAVGGRGTRGSVFRVRYAPATVNHPDAPLEQVLAADQPLASWSRAQWVPLAKQLGREQFVAAMLDNQRDVYAQIRALEALVELFGGLTVDEARRALALKRPTLAARVAWALSRPLADPLTIQVLASLTYEDSPSVTRAAWEAIASLPTPMLGSAAFIRQPNWAGAADNNDGRRVHAGMLLAARNGGRASFNRVLGNPSDDEPPRRRLARLWLAERPADGAAMPAAFFDQCLAALKKSTQPDVRLEALRLLQIGLGDLRIQPDQPEVHSGYTGNAVDAIDDATRWNVFSGVLSALVEARKNAAKHGPAVEREAARLLAMLAADGRQSPEVIISYCTSESSPVDDIHYLIVLSRLTGPRSDAVTFATATALAGLHRKMAARRMYPDANWPLRVGEMFDELCRRDPKLAGAVADDRQFGLAAHSLFAAHMRDDERRRAARRLLDVAQADTPEEDESRWTPQLVSVVASLADEECLPDLREQWSDFGLRDAIALALAARAKPEDRAKLVEALASPQGDVVARAAEALASLGTSATPAELATALRTLKSYCAAPEQRPVRWALAKLLSVWSGEHFEIVERDGADPAAAYAPWFDWFANAHPEESKTLAGFGGADAAAWRERLAGVDWDRGDRARGKRVFEKRSCNRCHVGGGRLGPDLAGAARRFSRDDLYAAIVDPSRDVSPLYQTTLVVTRAGQVYHGLLVYDSADGLLLQTGPDVTVRVTGDDILTTRPSRQSLMPSGLLNEASDEELADLYVYLKELSK
ncbi:MAG TPA: c-type cytochrome, partial [Pirellulales bacterium]|nr:c-type cytochrome [Pirellulales bacterium]